VNPSSIDLTPVHFSTDEIEERDRIEMWREVYGRTILRLVVEPHAGDPFRSSLTLRTLPGLGIASGSSSRVCYRRTCELVDTDDFLFLIGVEGSGLAAQRQREVHLGAGDATLLGGGAETGYTDFPSEVRYLSLSIPYKKLAPMIVDPHAALARRVPSNTEALQLLSSYVGLVQKDYALASPELRQLVVMQVYDLVALAIGATRETTEISQGRGVRAARLQAIKSDIIRNAVQRPFSIEKVAARQGVTPRYIRRLFESTGETFTEFVLAQRLNHAHRMLTDVRYRERTISAIALDAGFGDLSYFNRSFRRAYGCTPSEVR
jgi:AraC-like DNA-binding protein